MTTPPTTHRHRTGPILAVISLCLDDGRLGRQRASTSLCPTSLGRPAPPQTQITWIVDSYTVVFAGLLLFAGALGDRFGRRGLLIGGCPCSAPQRRSPCSPVTRTS
jgi:MFS family permease